tara:strand:- start:1518 stop:1727 length:210 start_codon:yes stop_codon:yes gene_type:complete
MLRMIVQREAINMYNPNEFCNRFAVICGELLIEPSLALENENICKQIAVVGESLDDKISNLTAILNEEF